MANPKNPSAEITNEKLPDFSKWETEQTGFDPYWTPAEGKFFFGHPVSRDDSDPDFVRYRFKSLMTLQCHTGPKEEQEPVTVKPGEYFSVSVYYALDPKFNEYMESGLFPAIRVEAIKEVKTKKPGQTCWKFDLKISPDDRKRIDSYRKEKAQLMAEKRAERAALQEAS